MSELFSSKSKPNKSQGPGSRQSLSQNGNGGPGPKTNKNYSRATLSGTELMLPPGEGPPPGRQRHRQSTSSSTSRMSLSNGGGGTTGPGAGAGRPKAKGNAPQSLSAIGEGSEESADGFLQTNELGHLHPHHVYEAYNEYLESFILNQMLHENLEDLKLESLDKSFTQIADQIVEEESILPAYRANTKIIQQVKDLAGVDEFLEKLDCIINNNTISNDYWNGLSQLVSLVRCYLILPGAEEAIADKFIKIKNYVENLMNVPGFLPPEEQEQGNERARLTISSVLTDLKSLNHQIKNYKKTLDKSNRQIEYKQTPQLIRLNSLLYSVVSAVNHKLMSVTPVEDAEGNLSSLQCVAAGRPNNPVSEETGPIVPVPPVKFQAHGLGGLSTPVQAIRNKQLYTPGQGPTGAGQSPTHKTINRVVTFQIPIPLSPDEIMGGIGRGKKRESSGKELKVYDPKIKLPLPPAKAMPQKSSLKLQLTSDTSTGTVTANNAGIPTIKTEVPELQQSDQDKTIQNAQGDENVGDQDESTLLA